MNYKICFNFPKPQTVTTHSVFSSFISQIQLNVNQAVTLISGKAELASLLRSGFQFFFSMGGFDDWPLS